MPYSEGEREFLRHEDVSRETLDRLRILCRLLERWNPAINLVSSRTMEMIWVRHVLDSSQLFRCNGTDGKHWLDVGSGAGFPGMVLAIIAAEKSPSSRFTLVESASRKCQFLDRVKRATGVPVAIRNGRAETIEPQSADVVTARAVAPLSRLLAIAWRHLGIDGTCLFPKGANRHAELDLARQGWKFEVTEKPSITAAASAILLIRKLERN